MSKSYTDNLQLITDFSSKVRGLLEGGEITSKSPHFCKPVKASEINKDGTDYIAYYSKMIKECDILIDDSCGVKNYIYKNVLSEVGGDNSTKSDVRFRDARNAKQIKPED